MSTQSWTLHGLDTWFFRESRPHEAIGGTELGSLFPPPARTVAGALRTAIGNALGVDWQRYAEQPGYQVGDLAIREILGIGDDLGQLRLRGPWLQSQGRRLYPVPLSLVGRALPRVDDIPHNYELARLGLGPATLCDLGEVRLPMLPPGLQPGFKPLAPAWIDAQGLTTLLDGGLPQLGQLKFPVDLYTDEPRTGIARDNQRRVVQEGMLYQTRHLRLTTGTALEIETNTLDAALRPLPWLRLGGEGRLASLSATSNPESLPKPPQFKTGDGLLLILLTPADFGAVESGQPFGLPPGFRLQADGRYKGTINEVPLTLHGAVIGKPQREGGWDLAARGPRPVTSLVPAGSLWFCRVDGDPAAAAKTLQQQPIGQHTALGRGILTVGRWPARESFETRTTASGSPS